MTYERRMIEFDGMRIPYTLHIKKVKNITVRISSEGALVVTSNPYIPMGKVESFLLEKVKWILNKQAQQMNKAQRRFTSCASQDDFYVYDKKLKLVRIQSNQNSVRIDDENIYVYYTEEKRMDANVQAFIRKRCERDFSAALHYYFDKMKDYRLECPTLSFRTMSSRWGSCIPQKNKITLNLNMIHYPKEFMEYVVMHELAHLIEPNHSTSFYRVVEYYMPDYKRRQALIQ